MNEFFQQFINGLALGSIYALIALGYTMVYGVLRFINFAHGDVFMVGAFAAFYLAPLIWKMMPRRSLGAAVIILIASMAACALLGIVIELLAYRPLRRRPKLTVLITAIGVSLLLEYVGQHPRVFGASPQSFPELVATRSYRLGGVIINSNELLVLGLTICLLFSLQIIVLKTRIGTAMRALSFSWEAASLMGINTNRVIMFTFGLGSALAAAAGILYAMNYTAIDPLMGIMPGLKAFTAAVLGGIGNLPGAALGGLLIGMVEVFIGGTDHLSPYRDALVFAILILILLFKPSGLLGRPELEKV